MDCLPVIVVGAAGRMGQELVRLCQRKDNLVLKAKVDLMDGECLSSLAEVSEPKGSMIVDFSTASVFSEVVNYAIDQKLPLVSGTTGISDEQIQLIDKAAQSIPIIWEPNMSFGVAVLNRVLKQLSVISDRFDFQIEEFHHRHKIDAPSGTAKRLQETLKNSVGKEVPEPLAIRGGGIFGVHKVWAMSEEETLCFEHTALNRSVFAKGALLSALWLKDKAPGRYSIEDVLGENLVN